MADPMPPFVSDAVSVGSDPGVKSSEPPLGFFIFSSLDDAEPGGFGCSSPDCDGIVCGTVEECHAHTRDWHSPPYTCAVCQANFAAAPALTRHSRATGHQKWACQKEGCELKGFDFGNHLSYRDHILASAAHSDASQWRKEPDKNGCDWAQIIESDGDDADALSDCPPQDEFMCLEACCRYYLKPMAGKQYDAHLKCHGHQVAVKEDEILRQQNLDKDELEAKRQARRDLRCDKQDCSVFGRIYSSTQSYYHHLETASHVSPPSAKESKSRSRAASVVSGNQIPNEDDVFGPVEENDSGPKRCNVAGCLQFGRQFRTIASYERHIDTRQHSRAASRHLEAYGLNPMRNSARVKFQLRGVPKITQMPFGGDGERSLRTPTPTPTGPWSPSTASSSFWDNPSLSPFPRTPSSALSSPTPIGARERYLERRNQELEEELKQLQGQLDQLHREW